MKRQYTAVVASLLAAAFLWGPWMAAKAVSAEIPRVSVRFAHFPYFDHTQSIIGLEKGWYDEVGIDYDPAPHGIVVQASEASAVFASGRVDVMSASAQLFLPAAKTLPPYKVFFYADIFQGYAIMAQPDSGAKSFQEFLAEGMSADDAFLATMGQLRGKRFAFPTEAAIKGFINLAIAKGGMTLADVDAVGAPDDPANVALMQAGRADFQVGGVPSRMTLQIAGFVPILTSGDLAAYAGPSADSVELRAVFHDGWVASDEWIAANYDTVLRLASVGFRINQFINDTPDMAAAIHTPFLNSVAGTSFADRGRQRRLHFARPVLDLRCAGRLDHRQEQPAERRVRHRLRHQDLRGAGALRSRRVPVGQLHGGPQGVRRPPRPQGGGGGPAGEARRHGALGRRGHAPRPGQGPARRVQLPGRAPARGSGGRGLSRRAARGPAEWDSRSRPLNWFPRAAPWHALGILAAVAVWELAALQLGQYRLPSIARIAPQFFSLLTESKTLSFQGGGDRGYWPHLVHTIVYTIGASALGVATGVAFALLIVRFRMLRAVSEVPLELLRTIPPLAAIPFVLIWIGPGDPAQVMMVWYYVFVMMAFATLNAAANVSPILPRFAATFGRQAQPGVPHRRASGHGADHHRRAARGGRGRVGRADRRRAHGRQARDGPRLQRDDLVPGIGRHHRRNRLDLARGGAGRCGPGAPDAADHPLGADHGLTPSVPAGAGVDAAGAVGRR